VTTATAVKIALCTVTYLRPAGLAQLLDAISRLHVEAGIDLRVLVVDNDPDGSARAVVDAHRSGPFPVDYVVEPQRGIAFARNRALASTTDVDLVGFIDDDEEPQPDWLDRLLEVWRATDAVVVVGPSIPEFPAGTPQWIIDGGFFDRKRFATGEVIEPGYARTSGVLISTAALRTQPAFDTTYPFTGGEDSELFHRLAASGGHIVWSDDAHVVEHVPLSRANARWLLMRQYRIGNAQSLRFLPRGAAGVPRRARRVVGALARAAISTASLAGTVGKGRDAQVRKLQKATFAVGQAAGALGISYKEYRVVHGR
jgi:glycosyltransferase involved in cell wall biosynthesis